MFQQTIKNFNINFNSSSERTTVSSGDLITGHISFDVTKEIKINSITLRLKGAADVHWSSGGGKKSRRRVYTAKVDYFDLKSVLVQHEGAVGGTTKLQPGTHVYPISCLLPQGDFPSTFRGIHGKVMYTLTVGINRPWHMAKEFVTELNFAHRFNTNQPELRAPLSGSNYMTLCCLWCASGPITVSASAEKKAFVPGETVKIICKFNNASSRTATPKVSLQQKQVYYDQSKIARRRIVKNLTSVAGEPVSAHTTDVRTEIILTIPTSAYLTISNCSMIEVDYLIEVKLSIRAAPDLTVLIPIIMCDTPVSSAPPPYM